MALRINSSHSYEERGLDAYFTPVEAVRPLIALENLPKRIWEPACGDGAIVKPLMNADHEVWYSDIKHYGLRATIIVDYLTANTNYFGNAEGIITNPPFKLAQQFAEKAISEADYVAFYLRLNWLEGSRRMKFFQESNLTRVLVSSRRLPMMHRHGWTGNKVGSSNIAFAWFIWDHRDKNVHKWGSPIIKWFDWKDFDPD